uniref:HDC16114 n=1 Tax=Drosophila melanogaster TaxID=7227 RepID=Q6IJ25_DROME|nr:TPA_inf: HDC16114 [Drosophila melanogaster]
MPKELGYHGAVFLLLTAARPFDDSISTRRRKERSKRSHRKSPAASRRQHKYRYRDETSHSSSRRRHRDRAKDERDSGRNNRQSQAKRYLEKSQQVADHFESSQIPCYIKMRDLPAPPVVDHCRDLILSSCSLRFMPYTDDWIVVEYFVDHDSDYLAAKIQYFKQLEQQLIIRNGANGCGLETYLEEDASPGDGESVAITRCLLLKRQRNHFDLVALSDMPVDKYAGDNWIIEEYFVDHNDDYLLILLSRRCARSFIRRKSIYLPFAPWPLENYKYTRRRKSALFSSAASFRLRIFKFEETETD